MGHRLHSVRLPQTPWSSSFGRNDHSNRDVISAPPSSVPEQQNGATAPASSVLRQKTHLIAPVTCSVCLQKKEDVASPACDQSTVVIIEASSPPWAPPPSFRQQKIRVNHRNSSSLRQLSRTTERAAFDCKAEFETAKQERKVGIQQRASSYLRQGEGLVLRASSHSKVSEAAVPHASLHCDDSKDNAVPHRLVDYKDKENSPFTPQGFIEYQSNDDTVTHIGLGCDDNNLDSVPLVSMACEDNKDTMPLVSMVCKDNKDPVPLVAMVCKDNKDPVPLVAMVCKDNKDSVPLVSMICEENKGTVSMISIECKDNKDTVPLTSKECENSGDTVPHRAAKTNDGTYVQTNSPSTEPADLTLQIPDDDEDNLKFPDGKVREDYQPFRRRIQSTQDRQRSRMKTRFTKSACTSGCKLLYLRDNGTCNRQPSSGSQNGSSSKIDESYTSNPKPVYRRITVNQHIPISLDEEITKVIVSSQHLRNQKLKHKSKNCKSVASENRKQRYLEEVFDSHLYMRIQEESTIHRARYPSKPRSAPQLRFYPGTKSALHNNNNNNTSTSDHIISLYEWNKMSRLRYRMRGGEVTPAEQEFRDLVKEKKNRARLLLRVITRMFLAIQYWSSIKTTRTAAELQWFTLNSSSEAKTLAFNKELFTKARAQATVPEWAKQVMGKLPDRRTVSECRKLHALMRGLKSFEKFTERIQLAMCRSLRYENIDSMRIILRKGHIGLNFYFIYSGSVFINVDDVDAQGRPFVKTEVILSRGDSFGEVALLREVARTATVSARENCELLTVDREVFSTLCPQIFDKELEEKIEFMKTVPLFQNRWWTPEAIRDMCFQAHIQEYKTNRIVVADSTTDDWMYICMTGKCKIIRHLHLEPADFGDVTESLTEDNLTSEMMDLLTPDEDANNGQRSSRRRSSFRRRSMQKDKTRLLQSMALDFVDPKQSKGKNSTKEESSLSAPQALTLSALVSQARRDAGDTDVVFLDIGTLNKGEVFDLESILDQKSGQTNSKLILVSGGASLIRMKRSKFFQNVNEEGLQYALTVASKQRYPSDHVLLRSYNEQEVWDHYKHRVVRETLRFRLEENAQDQLNAASEERQAEVERSTKRLLKAFTKKSNSPDMKVTSDQAVDIHKLGDFILETGQWKTGSSKTAIDMLKAVDVSLPGSVSGESRDGVIVNPSIPVITIS